MILRMVTVALFLIGHPDPGVRAHRANGPVGKAGFAIKESAPGIILA